MKKKIDPEVQSTMPVAVFELLFVLILDHYFLKHTS